MFRGGTRRLFVAALASMTTSGCSCLHGPVEKYPDGGQLVCDQGQVCGPGTYCYGGFCVLSADAGEDAGAIEAGPDASAADAGSDAGPDAGLDAGPDAGATDAGCAADAGTSGPSVQQWLATCAGGAVCIRDDLVTFSGKIAMPYAGSLSVRMSYGSAQRSEPIVVQADGSFSTTVDLQALPIAAGAGNVAVDLVASNGCGSVTQGQAAVAFTRIRWTVSVGNPATEEVTSSAYDSSAGAVYVGVSTISAGTIRALDPATGQERWRSQPVGALGQAPPVVGLGTIWFLDVLPGSPNTGRMQTLGFAGGGATVVCSKPLFSAPAPPALLRDSGGTANRAVAASHESASTDNLMAATSACDSWTSAGPYYSAVALFGPEAFVLEDKHGLRKFTYTSSFASPWYAPLSLGALDGPIAIDAAENVFVVALDGSAGVNIFATQGAAAFQPAPTALLPSGTLDYLPNSIIIGSSGDLILPAPSGRLWRVAPTPSAGPTAVGIIDPGYSFAAPLAVSSDPSGVSLYAASTSSQVFALDGQFNVVWRLALSSSPGGVAALNVATHVRGAATVSSLLINLVSGDLVAIAIDSPMDATAPWPRAFHDPANTSNVRY
jgi:outer membrane protein assembly factor BamB